MNKNNKISKSFSGEFVQQIKKIIANAQSNVFRAVNSERVVMYWKIGEKIFIEEQMGKERAEYGSFLIENLSKELTVSFGLGFSQRQLETCRQFYKSFPIPHTLRAELNWSQYKLLIRVDDRDKQDDENPTIGILLCADKNDAMVELVLPKNNNTILASKYQLYLPTKEQMLQQMNQNNTQ